MHQVTDQLTNEIPGIPILNHSTFTCLSLLTMKETQFVNKVDVVANGHHNGRQHMFASLLRPFHK